MIKIFYNSFIIASLLLWNFSNSTAQQKNFKITWAGKQIGSIEASLIEERGIQSYNVVSDVTFKVLWKTYNRVTKNKLIYSKTDIIESQSGIYMNYDLEDSASIILKNNQYSCYRFPDKNFIIEKKEIHFPSMNMYFEEPLGIKNIYSERFLEYCPIVAKEDHKYVLYLPNGHENVYTYKNGILVEVFVDRTWFNLRFVNQE